MQASPSSQPALVGKNAHLPDTHAASLHTSPALQSPALLQPSPQPLIAAWIQAPVCGLQLSEVQVLVSAQGFSAPGLHVPLAQLSPTLQASPSSQGAVLNSTWHAPVEASQVSTVQGFLSSQPVTEPAWQLPFLHASPAVQALPSLHAASLGVAAQAPLTASHLSWVHGLPSSHSLGWPALHAPALQVSATLHASPSLHGPSSGVDLQPWVPTQLSWVQGFWSLQSVLAAPTHRPSLHLSPLVQASLSSQSRSSGLLATLQVPPTHLALVHSSLPQSLAFPVHWPLRHLSPLVQGSSSVHGAPSSLV